MVGDIINERYRLLRIIGKGGMATVYLARDLVLGRDVAAKLLLEKLSSDRDLSQRFLEEARMAALLDHPNIVKIFDFGQTYSGSYFIIYEYISGFNFHVLQKERERQARRPFEAVFCLMVAFETLKALENAHRSGLIHRDVKPDNIMLTVQGKVKLMDFGIAKNMYLSHTQKGQYLGSPFYSSPEQVEGGHLDFRTDIYSLGVVLYEAMSGRLPFPGNSPSDVMMKIVHGGFTPLKVVTPHLAPSIADCVERALSKNPQNRFESASVMLEHIQKLLLNFGVPSAERGLASYFTNRPRFLNSIQTQTSPRKPLPQPVLRRKTLRKAMRIEKSALRAFHKKQKYNKRRFNKRKKAPNDFPYLIVVMAMTLILIAALFIFARPIKSKLEPYIRKLQLLTPSSHRESGASGTRHQSFESMVSVDDVQKIFPSA